MKNDRWAIFYSLIPISILYFQTLAPTIVQIDSGELAAVQASLGIAHPTGYPLFTILGYLFLKIPLFSSQIRQLNFLSMTWCLLSLLLIQLTFHHFPGLIFSEPDKNSLSKKTKSGNAELSFYLPWIACLSVLFLAFSKTFWEQGTSIEVHSLQSLILGFILLSLTFASKQNQSRGPWILTAICLGLGTANHLTTLLAFPGIAVFFFMKKGFGKRSWILLGMMFVVFSSVVSFLYAYLPWRTIQNPILNWGNPATGSTFLRHVSGKQYSTWMFQSIQTAFDHLYLFLKAFPGEFSYLGIGLGLLGLIVLLARDRSWSTLSLLLFSFSVFYAVNYNIHDIETYFLAAYIVFTFWIFIGTFQVVRWIPKQVGKIAFLLIVTAVSVHQGFRQFSKVNQSKMYLYSDYTYCAMQSLPLNSVLLTYQWDYLVSPSLYIQIVDQYRQDIVIVDKELLRRSWYYHQLRRSHPQLVESAQSEIKHFLDAVAPFEKGEPYNAASLEARYRTLMTALIKNTLTRGCSVFIGPELVNNELRRGELNLPVGSKIIPHLFFFQVVLEDEYLSIPDFEIQLRFPEKPNRYSDSIKELVANMWIWRTYYEIQQGRMDNGTRLINLLRSHFPNMALPKSLHDHLEPGRP